MCGIAGILTARADLDLPPLLAKLRAALRHRGPDDEGDAVVPLPGGLRLGLAHTRLAILDLSPAGHQPMHDPATGSWITYNGEIYNHLDLRRGLGDAPFRSTSDTETILRGWARHGDDLLASLRGMFAFALYDGLHKQFWLARDRRGVKPLYACRADADTWVFASEVRALLATGLVPRRLDLRAVDAFLSQGAVPAPWTLLDGVRSLLPAEAWRFDLDAAQPLTPVSRRYWRPPFADRHTPPCSYGEAVERLRPVLKQAAELRMLADVPVGVFLSGGIDSGSLVSLLTSAGYPLYTFSVVFAEGAYNEAAYSRLLALRFGTHHTELTLHPAEVLRDFDRALAAYDQPSIDGLNTYTISQAVRRAGVKVALSGLGGDELFAGYPYFRLASQLESAVYQRLARWAHLGLRWLRPDESTTTKLGQALRGNPSRLTRYTVFRQVMPPPRIAALRGDAVPSLPEEVALPLEEQAATLDPVNAHSLMELSLYLGNMLLRDTDQMSMAHGLEVREPLLDHVLIETVAALPGVLKLRGGRRGPKALLCDALPIPLPPQVRNRAKAGFVFPWEQWLRGDLAPRLHEVLGDTAAVTAAGLNVRAVRDLWTGFLQRRPGIRYTDVFCLSNLVHWVNQHKLSG